MDKDETPSVVKLKWRTSAFMDSQSSIINPKSSKESESSSHRGNRRSSDVTWCLLVEDVHGDHVPQERDELNKEPQKSPGGSSSQKKQPLFWWTTGSPQLSPSCRPCVFFMGSSGARFAPLQLYCTRMQHSANTEAKINRAEGRRARTS